MNNLEQITALIVLVVTLLGVIATLVQTRKFLHKNMDDYAYMKNDMRALCNAAVQVGERVNRIEKSLNNLQQRQKELGFKQDKLLQVDSREVSFDQAIKLARKGNSVEEIMEICNIARGEAELINMMHRLDPENKQ